MTILSIGLWCPRYDMLCDPEEQVDDTCNCCGLATDYHIKSIVVPEIEIGQLTLDV